MERVFRETIVEPMIFVEENVAFWSTSFHSFDESIQRMFLSTYYQFDKPRNCAHLQKHHYMCKAIF